MSRKVSEFNNHSDLYIKYFLSNCLDMLLKSCNLSRKVSEFNNHSDLYIKYFLSNCLDMLLKSCNLCRLMIC
jgi:hypothetical protein